MIVLKIMNDEHMFGHVGAFVQPMLSKVPWGNNVILDMCLAFLKDLLCSLV